MEEIIDDLDPASTYTEKELQQKGLDEETLQSIKNDPYKVTNQGFFGGLVINHLHRQGQIPEEKAQNSYTPAVLFAKFAEKELSQIWKASIDGRRLVKEKSNGGARDLYVSSSDIHHLVERRETAEESELEKEVEQVERERRPEFIANTEYNEDPVETYFSSITESEPLSREEEQRLGRRIQNEDDEKALEKLVTANLKFVASYVKKYRGEGLNYEELISLGNKGLVEAAKKFNPDRGVKFISYAVWWIRQNIHTTLARTSKQVNIPQNVWNGGKAVRKYLNSRMSGRPTDKQIREAIEETGANISVDIYKDFSRIAFGEISLDSPRYKEDGDTEVSETLALEEPTVHEKAEERDRREQIQKALSLLSDRERQIMELYYGLDGQEELTLEQIGSIMGVTRERIRQLRNRGFKKIRESDEVRKSLQHYTHRT